MLSFACRRSFSSVSAYRSCGMERVRYCRRSSSGGRKASRGRVLLGKRTARMSLTEHRCYGKGALLVRPEKLGRVAEGFHTGWQERPCDHLAEGVYFPATCPSCL